MMLPLFAAGLFSVIASIAVAWAGRRDALGCDRLSGAALALLLITPLLGVFPGWRILPAGETPAGQLPWFLWLLPAGAAGGLLRLTHTAWRLHRRIGNAYPVGTARTRSGHEVAILESPGLAGPCAAGIRRRVILVPPGWRSMPAAARSMILAHELAHHQRRDPMWRWIAALACALHWFNPAVWWLARRHALHAEIACDSAVVSSGFQPDRYAHLLCDLALPKAPPLAAAMAGPMLGRRIRCLQGTAPVLPRLILGGAMALLVFAALACGLTRSLSPTSPYDSGEVHLRLRADPFPGNP